MTTMSEIEVWWRHLGCYDRKQASEIPYNERTCIGDYLTDTDNWWDSLTEVEKRETYEDFFAEY